MDRPEDKIPCKKIKYSSLRSMTVGKDAQKLASASPQIRASLAADPRQPRRRSAPASPQSSFSGILPEVIGVIAAPQL